MKNNNSNIVPFLSTWLLVCFLCLIVLLNHNRTINQSLIQTNQQLTQAQKTLQATTNSYEIQQVCDQSRTESNGISENNCGELQDKYNQEYVCNGIALNANCWVERSSIEPVSHENNVSDTKGEVL